MIFTPRELEHSIAALPAIRARSGAREIAWACVWLEACGYPSLELLAEALADPVQDLELRRDSVGLDLGQVSCVFLAAKIMELVARDGRVFLRNVRHGLYLLPFAVRANLGIGCPVDPAFAVGGERTQNPYAEKLALAEANGINVDQGLWDRLAAQA
ncbi:MAG: hypothetical protein ACT4SY_00910 [Hyphomicrobiales bacterium]